MVVVVVMIQQRRKGATQHCCMLNTHNLCFSVSIMVAQFLQDAAYDQVQTIAKELLKLAEKCKRLKRESPSECAHQLVGGSCVSCAALFSCLS